LSRPRSTQILYQKVESTVRVTDGELQTTLRLQLDPRIFNAGDRVQVIVKRKAKEFENGK